MPQFLVDPGDVSPLEGEALLGVEETRHLERVLRLRPGSPLALFDGRGRRWVGVLVTSQGGRARVTALRPVGSNEPGAALELVQGLPKGERWEWIIEKGTELGIARFRPVYTEFGVASIPLQRLPARLDRWRKVALAASKQCERAVVPEVLAPVPLGELVASLASAAAGETRLALTERLADDPVLPELSPAGRFVLAVGPEGGWSSADRGLLRAAGFVPWGLGPRVLRAETAALAGAALLLLRDGR